MNLEGVTWQGPEISTKYQLDFLPEPIANLLKQINGFILWEGALHFRGICEDPQWHSIQYALELINSYDTLEEGDIPFAQDCVGDQFIFRETGIHRLLAETGELEPVAPKLSVFLQSAQSDPVEFLGLHPLMQLRDENVLLEPGQLIFAYPPFCTKEASSGVSLKAVHALELIDFHARLANNLPGDGSQLHLEIVD